MKHHHGAVCGASVLRKNFLGVLRAVQCAKTAREHGIDRSRGATESHPFMFSGR